eukprot:COSAG04_NODE_1251_length_7575_cov_2.487426_3_plen_67_part_00
MLAGPGLLRGVGGRACNHQYPPDLPPVRWGSREAFYSWCATKVEADIGSTEAKRLSAGRLSRSGGD